MERSNLGGADFTVCPHCWHVNPPSRLCARCLADMTLLLQESGGRRWTAPAQSPLPVRARERLSRTHRGILLGVLVLYGVAQLALAFAGSLPGAAFQQRPEVGVAGPTTDDK